MSVHYQNYMRAARLTGLLLLIVTLTHMAGFQMSQSFVVSGDFLATSLKIAQGEALFRFATFSYVESSVLSVGLAVGFFLLIEPINRMGALMVLAWRLFEAIVASCGWAIRFALIDNQTQSNLLGEPGAEALHVMLRNVANAGFDVSAIGLSIASIIGFAILFSAKTISRILCAFGVIGGVIVLVTSTLTLVWPHSNLPTHLAFAVTLLSQLAIGAWLLAVGAKHPHHGETSQSGHQ